MKRLVYPSHILQRMEQRGITRRQIEVTIKEWHHRVPVLDKRRKRVMRNFGTRELDVIYEERPEYIILVTAFWLSGSDRKVKPQ